MSPPELVPIEIAQAHYSADSPLRSPRRFLREWREDVGLSWTLGWQLLRREVTAQHRQSVLGYAWVLVPPLATTLVWTFLQRHALVGIATHDVPYPAFLLTGTTLWGTFVDALRAPLKAVGNAGSMITKVRFPREALLVAGVGEVLFNAAVRSVLLLFVLLAYRVSLTWTVLAVPLGMLALVGLGTGLGLLVAPVGLLYHDVGRAVTVLSQIWLYLTPVVYPAPTQWPATLVVSLNPVSPLLVTTRDWLLVGSASDAHGFLAMVLLTAMLLVVGLTLYRVALPVVIERLGS
ncbi:MAG: ABC transporter permease [Myxococcota bacterium]